MEKIKSIGLIKLITIIFRLFNALVNIPVPYQETIPHANLPSDTHFHAFIDNYRAGLRT